jgi:hypothetical protein
MNAVSCVISGAVEGEDLQRLGHVDALVGVPSVGGVRQFPGADIRRGLRGRTRPDGRIYWMYDAERRRFRIIFFSNNGPYSDAGNQYAGEVADDKLTMVGPARFQYELDADGTIKSKS